jgi:hypothetical protein
VAVPSAIRTSKNVGSIRRVAIGADSLARAAV